jgi:hypothetical protein
MKTRMEQKQNAKQLPKRNKNKDNAHLECNHRRQYNTWVGSDVSQIFEVTGRFQDVIVPGKLMHASGIIKWPLPLHAMRVMQ